jgi:pSer/pThr/pTyr-binding forkhead associated (FHA) protein
MVAATVTLTVTAGSHAGKRFTFSKPEHCVAGRAADCSVQLVGAFEDALLSRHHCAFDIDPPHVHVRDLGSRNGTFVNGQRIGYRDFPIPPEPAAVTAAEVELHDGDELCLGPIPFKVLIHPRPAAN